MKTDGPSQSAPRPRQIAWRPWRNGPLVVLGGALVCWALWGLFLATQAIPPIRDNREKRIQELQVELDAQASSAVEQFAVPTAPDDPPLQLQSLMPQLWDESLPILNEIVKLRNNIQAADAAAGRLHGFLVALVLGCSVLFGFVDFSPSKTEED